MLKKTVILYLLHTFSTYAQQSTRVKGIVFNQENTIEQVTILNQKTQQSSITNRLGKFSIGVEINDTLVFKHTEHILKKIIVTPQIITENELTIELKSKITKLNEVVVTTSSINASSLGIIQKPIQEYTKSERMLKTAGDFKPIHLLGILGGSLPVDPIINAITGRTKMLKKVIEKEDQNTLFDRIKENYKTYCINELNITTEEQCHAFMMYLTNFEKFDELFFSKNIELNLFNIKNIYTEDYLKIKNN